jgi:death-on-curing family protein
LIHDEYVDVLWPSVRPGSEPIDRQQFRNTDLLDSAVARPFQTFEGQELYPAIHHKAAALFHSLICNHCFQDGNKRTAVIAVDQFFAANGYILAVDSQDMYALAKDVATHNERGIGRTEILKHVVRTFEEQAIPLEVLEGAHDPDIAALLEDYKDMGEQVRNSPENQQSGESLT